MESEESGDGDILKLDPSRVVPHRSWDDPGPPDTRVGESQNPAACLWVAGLSSERPASSSGSTAGWLSGLVRDDDDRQGPVPPRPLNHRRTWQSGWDDVDEDPADSRSAVVPSTWLAGLIKEERKVALNDIARILFRGDLPDQRPKPAQGPTPTPPEAPLTVAEAVPFAPSASPSLAPLEARPTARPSPNLAVCPEPEVQVRLPRGLETSPSEDSPPPAQPASRLEPLPLPEGSPSPARTSSPEPLAKLPLASTEPAPKLRAKEIPKAQTTRSGESLATAEFRRVPARAKVSFYRSLPAMFDAGVPLFAIFEFLSRDGESEALSQACRRMGQHLAEGTPLNVAARKEPALFDVKAVRMLEVGYRGGQLPEILHKLAEDEEHAWRLFQQLKSQLTYPLGIAMITMLAVLLLPPLALNDLLRQVVSLTAEPPLLSRLLLQFSAFLGSPLTLTALALTVIAGVVFLRTSQARRWLDRAEMTLWFLPAVGPLWRHLVALRFLRVFSMVYQAGLPASSGLELAAAATGSHLAAQVAPLMKRALIEGGTLAESFAAGGFLPSIAIDAVNAGESSGNVPVMLDKSAMILQTEVESRIDATTKLIEPLVLSVLGVIVAVFVLACLLPIVELTSTL